MPKEDFFARIFDMYSHIIRFSICIFTSSYLATDDDMKIHIKNSGKKNLLFALQHRLFIMKIIFILCRIVQNFFLGISGNRWTLSASPANLGFHSQSGESHRLSARIENRPASKEIQDIYSLGLLVIKGPSLDFAVTIDHHRVPSTSTISRQPFLGVVGLVGLAAKYVWSSFSFTW